MRILLLAENLAFGGIGRYCVDLADGLRAYPDVHCDLLALSSAGDDWLLQETRAKGLDIEVLPPSSIRSFRNILVNRGIDLVHSQGYRSNIMSRLALRLGGSCAKAVCTVHGAYHFATAPWRSRFYYLADYLTMRLSDWVIAVSVVTRRQVARWVRKDRLIMIHNGTALPELSNKTGKLIFRQALGLPEQAKVACFVGRLSHQKGIPALIDIVRRTTETMPEVIFVIVGDGPLRREVESCAREIGAQLHFVGSQHHVQPFYLASDILLLPSRTEGLPMTLIEAFAYGLPAIASNVGGIPEVVIDGYNGFLCESTDTVLMSQQLVHLLRDDDLRARFAANARKTVETHFSLSSMVEATYRVYQNAIGSG